MSHPANYLRVLLFVNITKKIFFAKPTFSDNNMKDFMEYFIDEADTEFRPKQKTLIS